MWGQLKGFRVPDNSDDSARDHRYPEQFRNHEGLILPFLPRGETYYSFPIFPWGHHWTEPHDPGILRALFTCNHDRKIVDCYVIYHDKRKPKYRYARFYPFSFAEYDDE